jgi:tetratricopeptide (TPR) repeat protein
MLGIPLEQAGFNVPLHRRNVTAMPLTEPVSARPEEGSDPVHRRAFLTASGGAAIGAAIPASSAATPDRADLSERPRLGTDAVTDLRSGLVSLYKLDDRFGGTAVGPLAAAHLARVERLITTGSYAQTTGRQLQLIAGETAEHVGWLAFDAGDHPRARTYFGKALGRAEELRDDPLGVLAMTTMSLLCLRDGKPREALDLTRRAQDQARCWAPPTLLSILVTREARALALLSDATAARAALARAARLYEEDRGTRPAPSWTDFYGPAEIAYVQAQLFSVAGHHRAAVTWLRKALERQEATYARNEAITRGALAAALARSGEADEAAYQLTEGESLLSEVASGRARATLAEARHELARLKPQAL